MWDEVGTDLGSTWVWGYIEFTAAKGHSHNNNVVCCWNLGDVTMENAHLWRIIDEGVFWEIDEMTQELKSEKLIPMTVANSY